MKHQVSHISIATDSTIQFVDITDRVREEFSKSGVRNGLVTIFSHHTTTAVRISENCARLLKDAEGILKEMVPDRDYAHDEDTIDSRKNARGHIMSLFLGSSETVPVSNGEMLLGTWQSVFFIELDGPRKDRTVSIMVIGE